MEKTPKMYIVRKYIKANSASDALKKEKKAHVDDIWVDDQWKEGKNNQLAQAIGFDNGIRE